MHVYIIISVYIAILLPRTQLMINTRATSSVVTYIILMTLLQGSWLAVIDSYIHVGYNYIQGCIN